MLTDPNGTSTGTEGLVLGRYRILERLGAGELAVIYKVADLHQGGRPAVLRAVTADVEPDALERIRWAFVRLARLDHPRLLRVYDLDVADDGSAPLRAGQVFFTAELVTGQPAPEALARQAGRRRVALLWKVAADVASALDHLHQQGLCHGDVRPEHVQCTPHGDVKLVDPGLPAVARALDPAGVSGTLERLAPEVIRERPDERADLLALGATLWVLAAGQPLRPPVGGTPGDRLRVALAERPRPLASVAAGLPAAFTAVVDLLLAEAPAGRPRSARALVEDLGRRSRTVSLAVAEDPEGLPLLSPGLVGREAEVASLAELAAARLGPESDPEGAPAVVLLRGEVGAGRRAALAETVRRLALRAAVGELQPFAAVVADSLAEALGRLVRGTAPRLTDPAAWLAAVAALEAAVADRPAVLVIEGASGDLRDLGRLLELIRRDPGVRLGRLVLLLRLSPAEVLADSAQALDRGLPGLPASDLAELAARVLGETPTPALVETLARVSGGLPGLALELLRSAWSEVGDRRRITPEPVERLTGAGLVGLAGRRIGRLGRAEQGLALLLAAAAEPLTLPRLAAAAGLAPAEVHAPLLDLERHGLVQVRDGRAALDPPALARAVLAATEVAAGAGAHRRLAEAFARESTPRARLRHLRHLAASTLPEEAAPAGLETLASEAAQVARTLGDLVAEAELHGIAAAAAPAPARAAHLLSRAEALVRGGDPAAGQAVLAGLPGALEPADRLRAARAGALAAEHQGDLATARDLLATALADPELAAVPSAPGEAARVQLGRVLLALGDGAGARRLLPAPQDATEGPGGFERLEVCGLAWLDDLDVSTARACFEAFRDQVRDGEDPRAQARAQGCLGLASRVSGDLPGAAACLAEARRLAAAAGDWPQEAVHAAHLGAVLHEQGRLAEALPPCRHAVRRLLQLGDDRVLPRALFDLGRLQLDLGDVSAAARELGVLAREAERTGAPLLGGFLLLLASDLTRRPEAGRPALRRRLPEPVRQGSAVSLARHAAEAFLRAGAPREQALAGLAELEGHLAAGEAPAAARARRDELTGQIAALDDPVLLARLALVSGRLALLAPGRAEAAAGALPAVSQAEAFLGESGRRDLAWRATAVRAALLLATGQTAEAAALATAAAAAERAITETLGEPYPALRAADPDRRALAEVEAQVRPGGPAPVPARPQAVGEVAAAQELEAAQLRRLLEINKRLGSELRLPILLDGVLDAVIELTDAERGFVLLLCAGDVLEVATARNMDHRSLTAEELSLSQSIAEQAARSGEPVITVDAAEDARFAGAISVHGLRLRSVLAVPLRVKGRVVGTLYVDNRLRRGAFTEADRRLVQDFAVQAAMAIENARLHQELQERQAQIERLAEELAAKVAHQEEVIFEMRSELRQSHEALRVRYDYGSIVGQTPRMNELFRLLDRITDVDLPVVIHGESGTGKELVARAIHVNGPRKDQPFVSENCGAVPETLLESILFGHVRGAFTGADRDRRGLFEIAHGGTLFLDEIGEMSPAMQTKLLRVLQNGELRRVGGDAVIRVDVRVITASNQDLALMVEEKRFRQDLFYRLNVLQVRLPPLRERIADLPLLCAHFVEKYAPGGTRRISRAAIDQLQAYRWPGNVRELENEVQRALALGGDPLGPEDFSPAIRSATPSPAGPGGDAGLGLKDRVEALERDLLVQALEESKHNQSRAARLLGLSRFGLLKKMKRYGIT
jgi:transcriptional regulator with GAF, ATPase, and Fis domain